MRGVNEWPQIAFTIRGVAEELKDEGIDFQVIAVDNYCEEVRQQGREPDRGHSLVSSLAENLPWLTVLKYPDRLSHWQCKNLAVRNIEAPFLFFLDAHCMIAKEALMGMFRCYKQHWRELNGSVHLPLCYHILEQKLLIYRLVWDREKADAHYTFMAHPRKGEPILQVPVMSTCGTLIHRELYNLTGGWPEELGIYGGGENFLNFTLAVLGKKKWIFGEDPCYHHGERRGYCWDFFSYERNRLLATYLFGGEAFAVQYLEKREKIRNKRQFRQVLEEIVEKCSPQRRHIEKNQICEIEEWADAWEGCDWK